MSKKILHIIDNLGLWWAQTIVKWIFEAQNSNKNLYLFSLRKVNISIKINHENIIKNKTKFKFSFPIFKLKKIIKENKIDIIHCHLAKSQIIWGILKTFFFPKIKLVFHEHWEIFEHWKIYPFFMNLFKNKLDLFLAVSNLTKKKLINKTKINENKIIVIYNFVDLNIFKKLDNLNIKEERSKYNLKKDDFVIWFAARFIKRKWWLEILESAKLLKNKWYDFKFLLAWDWTDKEKIIEFIISNNLQKNIKIIWYIKDMDIFYNMIDVFVFPSHWEPLWLTWLEANACECPLIASNIEWLNEIIINKKNALLFKKQNSFDLTEKIIELFENEKLKKELIKWWIKEVKRHSLKKYLIQLDEIYE